MRGILKARLVLVAIVLAVGAATTVWAAIPDGDGVISGCYAKKGGKLRVVKSGKKCKKAERALAWSETGPRGSVGARGPAGPAGAKGPKGPSGTPSVAYTTAGGGLLNTTDDIPVAELDLPAGKYVLMGTSIARNGGDETGEVSCIVVSSADDFIGEVAQTVPAGESATITAQRAFELGTSATVSVVCSDLAVDDAVELITTLTAVPVGTLIDQF